MIMLAIVDDYLTIQFNSNYTNDSSDAGSIVTDNDSSSCVAGAVAMSMAAGCNSWNLVLIHVNDIAHF